MSTIWLWLLAKFGLGKLIAAGAIIVTVIAFITGVYAKGYYSCVSKYELAAKNAQIADLKSQILIMEEAAIYGAALEKNYGEAERKNDKITEEILATNFTGTGCLTPGFLQNLRRLQ